MTKAKPKPAAPKRPRKKPGPPATKDTIARALDADLTRQIRSTATSVFARIQELVEAGEEIPIYLLGTARLCAEWHTDYVTVVSALPDIEANA